MKPLYEIIGDFEKKYFNAPSGYIVENVQDFRDMLKEQPWEREAKKKWFLYTIYLGLCKFQDLTISYKLFRNKVRYFFKPTNKITFKYMPRDYVECDYKIFLGAFEIFGRWVEEECPFDILEITDELKEVKDLYDWWVVRRELDLNEIVYSDSDKHYEEDNEKLIKLVTMRGRLWC